MRFVGKKSAKGHKKSKLKAGWLKKLRPRLPGYFRESFSELKKVTWPTRRESWKMTFAVFVFSFAFAVIVVVADFMLEIVAKELFL